MRIALHVAQRVGKLKNERPIKALRASPLYGRTPSSFAEAFTGIGPRVIAEIKFASPSEGMLAPGLAPSTAEAVRVADAYLAAGAAALSVLTERNFFAGDYAHLTAVRECHPRALILMKDFMIDAYQFELARACGADAVLLIVALLGGRLADMLERARAAGLAALVEVHTRAELEQARAAGAELIGVNNRDLRTLKTDLSIARELAHLAPAATMIAESGLKTRADLDALAALGYKGFLIGTSFMKSNDPGAALKEMLA
jgi:indole-3-glycerol phosphate synthase